MGVSVSTWATGLVLLIALELKLLLQEEKEPADLVAEEKDSAEETMDRKKMKLKMFHQRGSQSF